jgi:UDPglucose--hexose-1-phosphate uridylyltransferase
MRWDEDLFVEVSDVELILPPESGVPAALTAYQREGCLEQPVKRRKDYITDTWCHINIARAERPWTAPSLRFEAEKTCFFCPGFEGHTPRTVSTGGDRLRIGEGPWHTRVFPNLYPWLMEHCNIVETPKHKTSLADIEAAEEANALAAAASLCREMEAGNRVPVLFRNHGWGASLSHFHWQVGALLRTPKRIQEELDGCSRFGHKWQVNAFDAIIESERARGDRWIAEDEFSAVIAPFAARTNYEVWIIAREPVSGLSACSRDQVRGLADMLTRTLKALHEVTQIDCLTVVCHQATGVSGASARLSASYRLHFEICPFKHWAGAERGLGEFVVEVIPEKTALELSIQMH